MTAPSSSAPRIELYVHSEGKEDPELVRAVVRWFKFFPELITRYSHHTMRSIKKFERELRSRLGMLMAAVQFRLSLLNRPVEIPRSACLHGRGCLNGNLSHLNLVMPVG